MLKHTPAPWHVDFCFETGIAIRNEGNTLIVAEAWCIRDAIPAGDDIESDTEAAANAHLIAAAPELYEALENMAAAFETMLAHYKRTMSSGDAYQRERLLQKACEAIAKSRGEVPVEAQ